jgi:Terminase large subunit, T4likevirus-type, N-terminal
MNLNHSLRKPHASVFRCEKRFVVVVAGRRWGKTQLALWRLVTHAFSGGSRLCYYLAPNCRQAKRVAWGALQQLIPIAARRRTSHQELLIELPNSSVIQLLGTDHPDSLRGVGLDFVVLDEFGNMDAETWPTVVRPMLPDRRGHALFIGTPQSYNHFYALYMAAKSRENWATYHFRTDEGGYVPPDELAMLRAEMDHKRYAQEFEASFGNLDTRVYYAFDRDLNVTDLPLLPNAPLLIGMDFNINPMTAVIAQRAADQCHVIDEIVLPNSNTQQMMQEISRRYQGREGVVHPDPSGMARKTSAPVGETDFSIIQRAGWPVYSQQSPYPLVDRLNTVNGMLCNAQGTRRLLISRSCNHLIKALDCLTFKEGTKIPDRRSGLDHITDALGYLIMGVFPMVARNTWSVQQVLI